MKEYKELMCLCLASLSGLLTYCVLRSTQPPTFSRVQMNSSSRVADWGGGMSARCSVGPVVG